MKPSNAASASILVSAVQMSCNARLAFACRLFGSLFRTFAVLCTQQRCARVFGHTSSIAFQKPSAPSATASSGAIARPRRLRARRSSFQDCTLSRNAVGKPNQFLLALGSGADDHQQTLRVVFEPSLDVDAIDPEVNILLDRQVAIEPAGVFVQPGLLQTRDGRG